jgi:hypothetical protein
MPSILLANATLVDAQSPEPRPGHAVLIEGERIKEVKEGAIRTGCSRSAARRDS